MMPRTRSGILRAKRAGARPSIAPKFLYDALGACLVDAITRLPEYYLARAEARLIDDHGSAIAERIGQDIAAPAGAAASLVDLGAGSCAKAGAWFGALPVKQ